MGRWLWGSAAGAVAVAAAWAGSATIPRPAGDGEIPDVLIENLSAGTVIEQYVVHLVSILRVADRAGDGLDRADIELSRAKREAQARARAVSEVLGYDLNGDFKITRDEIAMVAQGEEPYRAQQVQSTIDRFDGDGDGSITLAEADASAQESDGDAQIDALLALDPNRDGKLTAAELHALAERAFGRIDSDGDGKISPAEYQRIEERVEEARMIRSAPRCDLPPVPERAKLLVYGGYESDAISSVAVGGPDQETNFIDVTIEPGPTPLYLVLTSYESMVWRLSGATGRVDHVVVSSFNTARAKPVVAPARPSPSSSRIPRPMLQPSGLSASGVIGIARGKVTIAKSGCPGYFHQVDSSLKRVLAPVTRALGRTPDAVFGSYSARRVSLPSGMIVNSKRDSAPVPRGFDAASWSEAARFWPGGLVTVDPSQVVAAAGVAPYKVLPSQMGLSQLIGSGAIEQRPSGVFRIVKPIAHMPPSMGGAHSVTLIFAQGVPVPPGSSGHSCVIQEVNGSADIRTPNCTR
jgi:Ca2+-binding EF-hand superfamily protein